MTSINSGALNINAIAAPPIQTPRETISDAPPLKHNAVLELTDSTAVSQILETRIYLPKTMPTDLPSPATSNQHKNHKSPLLGTLNKRQNLIFKKYLVAVSATDNFLSSRKLESKINNSYLRLVSAARISVTTIWRQPEWARRFT